MLTEELFKMATKGLYNLGRAGASKAIKSNYAKKKIKGMADKYLDQALDSVTFLIYTYECFIRLKFVTETDIYIYLCSKDNTVVYAKGPLRNSAALVTSCV